MSSISASNLHLFVGRQIRIVYPLDRGIVGTTVIVDDMITPPVVLREHNRQTQEVTFERVDGSVQTMVPKEVWGAE